MLTLEVDGAACACTAIGESAAPAASAARPARAVAQRLGVFLLLVILCLLVVVARYGLAVMRGLDHGRLSS